MKSRALAVLLLAWFATTQLSATNPQYDPHWNESDIFRVQFNFLLGLDVADPGAPQEQPETVTYTYHVDTVSDGVATITATPDQPGWASWQLRFDAANVVLLSVQELGTTIAYSNPFVDDAWMAKLDQYHLVIIHDFPKIPDTDINLTRPVDNHGSSTPYFTQHINFNPGEGSVTATLSRTDPETSLPHQDTIVWRAGDKWWSSATTTLGGKMLISASLLPN